MRTRPFSAWLPADPQLRKLVAAAVLFWLFSYALMSLRGLLQADPLPLLSGRRLVSTVAGAGLFVVAARWLQRRERGNRLLEIALASVVATCALFALQSAAEIANQWEPRITATGQASWLLMWAGYFAAWLGGALAFGNRVVEQGNGAARLEHEQDIAPAARDVLWVQRNRQTIRVPMADIQWVEAEGNYARVHTAEGSGLLRGSLRSLEARLAPFGFLRVHRSVLCSKSRVRGVRREASGLKVLLEGGAEVPVGRAYAPAVVDALQLSSQG